MLNLKLNTSFRIIILTLFFVVANPCNVFSQNLSFEELLGLQKESKQNVGNFLNKGSWMQDSKFDFDWTYKNSASTDNNKSMFVFRAINCNKNIVYYKLSDSLQFKELKESSFKKSEKQNIINYPNNTIIEDFYIKDSYLRFYETHKTNQLPVYSVCFFSKEDAWYFGEINKYFFQEYL